MKRVLLFLLLLLLTLALLVACDATQGGEEGGDSTTTSDTSTTTEPAPPPPPVGDFDIGAEQLVIYDHTEGIPLHVSGADATADAVVTYEILSGGAFAEINENGTLFFTSRLSGACTVRAVIDGKVSRNTVSLYLARDKREAFAADMTALGFAALDLCDSLSLPLTLPDGSYTIEVGGGLRVLPVSEERNLPTLVVEGVPKGNVAVTIRDLDGQVYFSSSLRIDTKPIGSAVRASLIRAGVATSDTALLTPKLLASATELALTDLSLDSVSKWKQLFLLFPAVTKLDLTGSQIFDLSYLHGFTQITELVLCDLPSFDPACKDTFLAAIDSLTGLKSLSVRGAIGVLDRAILTELIARTKADKFALTVMDGVTLHAQSADGFLHSVFFSVAELKAHLDANNGKLVAASGYSHAVISYNHDADNRWNYIHLNAGDIATLEIYGGTRTAVSAEKDLTLNLYNGQISMSTNDGKAIDSTANIAINAYYGNCGVQGGWSVWWTTNGTTWCTQNESAVICRDLTLYAAPGASLTLKGGDGNIGIDGEADGSNPAYNTSQKHAARGDDGRPAIDAEHVTVLGGVMEIVGGNGGPGGKGGDGTGVNIFTGGYDAGNGGPGGNGGAGILCKTYTLAETANPNTITITGGKAGKGGDGGSGYALGKDGGAGLPGDAGAQISYK